MQEWYFQMSIFAVGAKKGEMAEKSLVIWTPKINTVWKREKEDTC